MYSWEKRECEVSTYFTQEPHSVAFHPGGFQLIVGFSDKLRLLNIFSSKLVAYKELALRSVREVRFSNGGHLFAAAHGNTIQV